MSAPAISSGTIESIRRYPVKSMAGEELDSGIVTERGLLGDRAFGLIDAETGKVASAKNPKRWPVMLDLRAAYDSPPSDASALPPVRVTLPDGTSVTSTDSDASDRISKAVLRSVQLTHAIPAGAMTEGYWPNHDWLAKPDQEFEFAMPAGTLFDEAIIHLVTTATLQRLNELAPASSFDVRRFRPNFVLSVAGTASGFVENEWVGKTIRIGGVQLRVTHPCPRCVMTTLAQGGLPKDPDVLRTAVQKNGKSVGVYAAVMQGGRVDRGSSFDVI